LEGIKESKSSEARGIRSPKIGAIKKLITSPSGKVALSKQQTNSVRQAYEALMPRAGDMNKQVSTGYQDYIDENLEIGDRIDLNTNNFRYLSYFTSIRKALDLVWVYPSEAVQRGLQGEAKVEFTILKDGRVERIRVLDGSGHKILDEAVVEAIKLAGPFTPLPIGLQKEKLTIVGSFRYVLSSFAGAL
jgi:TonB family protein